MFAVARLIHGMRAPVVLICLLILSGPGIAQRRPAPSPSFQSSYAPFKDYWWEQTYFEGFDMPLAANGPSDLAIGPPDRPIAIAAKGFIWLLDLTSHEAKRLTHTSANDSQPAWSPDGNELAFVRDDGHDTSIVVRTLSSGVERVFNTPAIELNPVFTPDGKDLFISSAVAGDLDIWKINLRTGTWTRITTERGLELHPVPLPDGRGLLYLARTPSGKLDELRERNLLDGKERVLRRGYALSQTRFTVDAAGTTVVVSLPQGEGWELDSFALADPGPTYRLLVQDAPPLSPTFAVDGRIVYSQWTGSSDLALKSISMVGGAIASIPILAWNWGVPTGTLSVETAADKVPIPSRMTVSDESGHPVMAEHGVVRLDPQNRRFYFYSPGTMRITVPAGRYTIGAVQGLLTPEAKATAVVLPGRDTSVHLNLRRVWRPERAGYMSGDHHFHLNYGGPILLAPTDLVPMMSGEALDIATPLVANLHTRMLDLHWKDWSKTDAVPFIEFGQEVRSGLSGHLGIVGRKDVQWPSFWGPRDPVFTRLPLSNADVLTASRGASFLSYVHPTLSRDPLSGGDSHALPIELVPDAVLGTAKGMEIVDIWSDELGTSDLWYNLLNLGLTIVPDAGTDAFPNFHRSMAIGTARVFVHLSKTSASMADYFEGLRQGRSFVTNGPVILFTVEGREPGEAVKPAGRTHWKLVVHSAVGVDRVEVLVNGRVVWHATGPSTGGSATYMGRLRLPASGWIAARTIGDRTSWPAMDSYVFAHSAPIWIDRVGSADPHARRVSAGKLLRALNGMQPFIQSSYRNVADARPVERVDIATRCLQMYSLFDIPGPWNCDWALSHFSRAASSDNKLH